MESYNYVKVRKKGSASQFNTYLNFNRVLLRVETSVIHGITIRLRSASAKP